MLGVSDTREIVYSIMSDTQRQQFENARQVDFSYSVPRTARMRVNAYLQRGAVSAALRVIPSTIQSLDALGMPTVVREMAHLPRGIVLVTGPTGSGKSTTLAAVIDEINNTREDHILTIEDPIEFLHSHKRCLVNQRELGSDATSFSEGLRAALREDPDVILVGEMRDLETISTALTAAETGPRVLATLHTQDAPQTVDRIIDVFPPHQQQHVRVMLSVALQGIVAQQLLPTSDGSGRVPAVEILVPTPAVRNLIREGKTHQIYSAIQTGAEYGMQTMDAALSSSLAKHPKIFSQLYVAMIRAGETGGFLEDALIRVAEQLESQNKLQRQVKSAMVYPAVVSSIAICVVAAMLIFIIPVFAGVFKQFGGTMPSLTKNTIAASNILRHQWYFVVFGSIGIVVGFRRWKGSKSGRATWDRFRLKAPAKIGKIVQKIALARWARTLSSLTAAGVPMLEAIEVTGRTAGNTVVENAMAAVRNSVQGGGTIASALTNESIFPSLVTNMVRVGEETGALDATLAKVADFYEEQVEAAVKSLTSILEPIMICIIGSIVGFMILAMYLPMFHVYDAIN